jgi:hypothetical protein
VVGGRHTTSSVMPICGLRLIVCVLILGAALSAETKPEGRPALWSKEVPNYAGLAFLDNTTLCFAKIKSGRNGMGLQRATMSVRLVDQRFIAEIHQHRVVLEIKPTAEDIEPEVSRPGLFSSVNQPANCSHENLLAQFAQDFVNILFRVTFRDQVNRRLPSQVT